MPEITRLDQVLPANNTSVAPPTARECVKWRRRWRKQNNPPYTNQAPKWWVDFFAHEFCQSLSKSALYNWGKLVGLIKFAFSEDILQELRNSYRQKLVVVT
ncbi:MAG: hypothetical protein QNJ47_14545 [Nostocaceae cyanobacterium]|nr:hypothetical protein [Nostocaceae cyanobacterium]